MKQNLKEQYGNVNNLDARINLYKKCGTNPQPWHEWVFEQMDLEGKRVLEVGCGTCELWLQNVDRIPKDCTITLMDFSQAMVDNAAKVLGGDRRFGFKQADIQALPFEDDQFDIVISNHMLYHVSDVNKAITEVRRVLKTGGQYYASTNAEGGWIDYWDLLQRFDARIYSSEKETNKQFNCSNGFEILEEVFNEVELKSFHNDLHIKEADALFDYVMSTTGLANITDVIKGERVVEFRQYLEDMIARDGMIVIAKRVGMFVSQ